MFRVIVLNGGKWVCMDTLPDRVYADTVARYYEVCGKPVRIEEVGKSA